MQTGAGDFMKTNFNELKNIIDEALMISMIKMLVYQEVKNRQGVKEYILKSKINNISDDFYKPCGQDFKNEDSFNAFIKKLSQEIIKDI
jgi:flavoprotein